MAEVDEFELTSTTVRPQSPSRRRSPQPWPWVICAGLLVLLGAAAAPTHPIRVGVGFGQDEPTGMLAVELTEPPVTVWSTQLGSLGSGFGATLRQLGDIAVVLSDPAVGVDISTGDIRWSLPTAASTCVLTTALVCTPTDRSGAIMTLDPATGATATVQVDGAVHAVAVEGGLVVAVDVDKGRLVKVDGTGAPVWDVPLDAAMVDGAEAPHWLQAATVENILYLSGAPLPYAVDVYTGEVQTSSSLWRVWDSPRGPVVTSDDPRMALVYRVGADGRLTVESNGPMALRIDDGRGADVQLHVEAGQLTATTADGDLLWTVPEDRADAENYITVTPTARLEGVVVVTSVGQSNTTSGYDLLYGDELWTLPDETWPQIITGSGSTLLWLMTGGPRTGTIGALDVHSGDDLWQADVEAVMLDSLLIDDGLLVLTTDALMRLAWPAEQ